MLKKLQNIIPSSTIYHHILKNIPSMRIRVVLGLLSLFLFPLSIHSDDTITATPEYIDTLSVDTVEKKRSFKEFVGVAMDAFTNFFMGCDTNYVTPQKYQFTTQTELSYWHDFYHTTARETGDVMMIESDPSLVLGGYIYYSIIGVGMSWNLGDIGKPKGETNGTSTRKSLSIHTAKIFGEIYKFNSGKRAKVTHLTDYDLTGKDNYFHGLGSECTGVTAFYIFNNKHFSWPAAFGENAVQRKSCGSFNLGLAYNRQKVMLNIDEMPQHLTNAINKDNLFDRIDYQDYSISVGYAYNWVIARNCLFAVSIQPAIGYRHSRIADSPNEYSIFKNLSTDLNGRASLFWNNTKYFSGLVFEAHTYSYHNKRYGLTNTYATLKFILGLNFLRKK